MQVEILKRNELIDIQVSPGFVSRLHELLSWMISEQDREIVKQANERIAQDQELQEWDEHYKTVLSLVADIEDAAKSQNKVELVNVPDIADSDL
jgi:hypothetical protein